MPSAPATVARRPFFCALTLAGLVTVAAHVEPTPSGTPTISLKLYLGPARAPARVS